MTPAAHSLSGKDYFTTAEAAHYACVSRSQFLAHACAYGIFSTRWMGRTVWRRADIQRAIEDQWQRSGYDRTRTASRDTGRSRGRTTTARTA